MSFLLVHGAFRGAWAWGEVPDALRARGHRVEAPSLIGMGELTPPPGRRAAVTLTDWVRQLSELARMADLDDIVLVGHSQGGMVARATAAALGDRLAAIAYLDSPLPRQGQRGVELSGPTAGRDLPPADTWLDPTPVRAAGGYGEDLAAFINDRAGPTPVGPSLDPMPNPEPSVPRHVAFCDLTPPGFPSTLARAAMDEAGEGYELFESPHDAALAEPAMVVGWLAGIAEPTHAG
jgi:pimeloyl-ACP methyl ester carboxylesterase